MKIKKISAAVTLCFFCIVQVSGCKTAQLAFPEGSVKNDFERYEVKSRGFSGGGSGKLTFGPYVVDWKSSGIKTSKQGSGDYLTVGEGSYSFTLSGENVTWNAKCKSASHTTKDATLGMGIRYLMSKVVNWNNLQCMLNSNDNNSCELVLTQKDHMSNKKGSVSCSGLIIERARALEGGTYLIEDAGYYISDMQSGKVVAVVDVTNDGIVYIARGLDKGKLPVIAAISAVLLVYKDPAY